MQEWGGNEGRREFYPAGLERRQEGKGAIPICTPLAHRLGKCPEIDGSMAALAYCWAARAPQTMGQGNHEAIDRAHFRRFHAENHKGVQTRIAPEGNIRMGTPVNPGFE